MPDLVRRAAIVDARARSPSSASWPSSSRSPLEEPANALVTPNPAKAPWYFLWLQEIVTDTTIRIGSFTINGAFVGGVVLPGLLVALLTAWPWLDRSPRAGRRRVVRRGAAARQNVVFLLLVLGVLVLTFVGTFLRGPYWHFYWPWEAWPEHARRGSDMEKRTDSPYPRSTGRCSPSSASLLVVSTVLFAWSDRAHDWRYYQDEFRRQVAEKFGAEKAATVPGGLQQIWVADLRPRRPLHHLPPGDRTGRASRRPSSRSAPIPPSR